ncbi:MAG: sulfatase-like hydrolase/transferase [Myxococcota bacterium]|nr:sulfatase-like hydrolase/transferase [Myxococcota bacterium]
MKGWLARPSSAVAGSVFGAAFVATFEGEKASSQSGTALAATVLGDVATLVPIATAIGLGVAALAITLDPYNRWTPAALARSWRKASRSLRTLVGAVGLTVPPMMLVWCLVCAHGARHALDHGSPDVVGFEMATVSIVMLLFATAGVVASIPFLMGRLAHVAPWIPAICGASFSLACVAVGVRLGDVSGNGPTALAVLGVLARRELDLSPLVAVLSIVVCAAAGERAARVDGHYDTSRTIGAMAVALASWVLVAHQAYALSEDDRIARAIELGAPLGRLGLALARHATDRDHDGASSLFGGGDCDDSDPRRSPTAIDIPGNGIDEDCSGADLPAPRPAAPRAQHARHTPPAELNLLLITVDTLRIDLGFMGYDRPVSPHLDALAARSTVFERAYSMASYTGKSVGATMTGRYPSECLRDGAHFDTYGPGNTLLAERLQGAGFHTMGVASHWYFKPKYGLAQGMDLWDLSAMPPESAGDADSSVTSAGLTDAAIALLSDPANLHGRFFLWVHYFDPHAVYVKHPESPDFRAGAKHWAKPLYDGEVWFTDHHIGRLLDFIAAQPWGDRTAVVLTADHGEAFEEHGMNWHGVDLWEPLVRVPLVIYVPGVAGHRVKTKRSLVDLVPTLLDILGVSQPPSGELSGESAALAIFSPDSTAPDDRDVYLDMPAGPEVSQHRAIIHGPTPGMKLMHEGGGVYFLFDLAKDPGERNDLTRDRPLFRRMVEAFDEKRATLREIHVDPAPYEAR